MEMVSNSLSETEREELLKIEEVARELRVNTDTAYRWVRQKKLRHVRIGRTLRVRRSDLDAFLENHTEGGST
ncbi:helix-turn-helix domain-containing protein [Planctomycetota bacterium]